MTLLSPLVVTTTPRRSRHRTHDVGGGRRLTVPQIARLAGVTEGAIYDRLNKGWTGRDLLRGLREKLYDVGGGERLSIKQIAERTGLATHTIRSRLARGWRGAELLVPNQERRRGGIARTPTQITALKLALAYPDRLPTTAEIRRLAPMSHTSAMRWRNAMRQAREHLGERFE